MKIAEKKLFIGTMFQQGCQILILTIIIFRGKYYGKEIFNDENRSEETGYGIEESEEPSVNTFSKEIIKEAKLFDNETKRNKENRKNELIKNCKEEIKIIHENESISIEEIQKKSSIKIKEILENYSIKIEDELNKLEAKREKEKVAYLNDKEKSIRERIKKENLAKQQEQESDFNKFEKILSIDPKNKEAIDKMRKSEEKNL